MGASRVDSPASIHAIFDLEGDSLNRAGLKEPIHHDPETASEVGRYATKQALNAEHKKGQEDDGHDDPDFGGGGGPDGGDPEPRRPLTPTSSMAAEIETPVEAKIDTTEQRVLVGINN